MNQAHARRTRGTTLRRVGTALLAAGWLAFGGGIALARRPACASGPFPADAGSTLTIDETTSPSTVLFTGCEPGTGRVHGARRVTRVVATFPSCLGLGRSTRARLRATIPFPSCDSARVKLIFPKGESSHPSTPPPTPGGYAAAVLPVLKAACAAAACHGGSAPQEGLNLSERTSYTSIVGKPSREEPRLLLVTPGDPANSYLLLKVQGAPGIVGARMPLTGRLLSPDQIEAIRDWIAAGAPND